MKSKIKTMKWQDVTIEQLKSHWDLEINSISSQPSYDVARYMNAYAYGDISGEGIDVRCEYADEVVSTYLKHIKACDIYDVLTALHWTESRFDDDVLVMRKHNDEVRFDICNGDAAYLTMDITDGNKNGNDYVSLDYYDVDEVTIDLLGHTQVVNERNIIDLFQHVCKKYYAYTEDAGEGMRNLSFGGHIIQVYPYNEYHNVWCIEFTGYDADGNGENNTHEIGDLAFNIQVQLLMEYEHVLRMKSRDQVTFDGDCVVYVGADGNKKRYALVDNSRDRDIIADTILNRDLITVNKLMHELGLWEQTTYVSDYAPNHLFDMVNTASECGLEVHMDIYVLHDYFLFGFIDPRDKTKYQIQGLADEREEWEKVLNIENVIDTILSSEDNFNIYKSVTNQK